MNRLALCALLTLATAGLRADPITAPELATAPKIDGVLDDRAWKSAAKIDTLYLHKTDTPVKDTLIYFGHDKAWLYLGFKCENANMPHVKQTVFKHDDAACRDDSVEVFLSPDGKRYAHFMLSFANVTHDKKVVRGHRDIGWNPVWRTATKRLPNGWTAEAAIPLYALGSDHLANARINLMRNLIVVVLDRYGAVQDERRVYHLLNKNTSNPHNLRWFSKLNGLAGFKPRIPFAPKIDAVTLSGYQQSAGKSSYRVAVTLIAGTPVSGNATVKVFEDKGQGYVEKAAQTVRVDGMEKLSLNVPVVDFRPRAVTVAVEDPSTGDRLAQKKIDDTSMLNVVKAVVPELSYYTSEAKARLKVSFSLSAAALKSAVLRVSAGERTLADIRGPAPETVVQIPVRRLALGESVLTLALSDGGRELATASVRVRRLKPRPGFEVKVDNFRGVVLKDGEPFFPVGMVMHGIMSKHEEVFKFLREEIGLNTLVRSGTYRESTYRSDIEDAERYMGLAARYGFSIVNWGTGKQPRPIRGKPLSERLKIHKANFEKLRPAIIRETEILRDSPNMLAYWNVDEPNLLNKEARIAVAEWYYKAVESVDPYRPEFLLYSKHIPRGDNWTRWGQILGYDVYPRPYMYMGGMYSEPGLATAYYSCDLRDRCRRDHRVMWFVPLANHLGPPRAPIGLSRAHMLCQAYTAIIYGAKGLLYFAMPCVAGRDAWDALKTIATQVKELSPALLAAPPEQRITYHPGRLRPREREFPMVNAAVFRYPNGKYLLLAANIKPFAVRSTFTIRGVTAVERCFGAVAPVLKGSAFTDKIEPYGVRAYRLKLPRAGRVEVAVNMAAMNDETAPFVDIPAIARQLKLAKNHCPNPCFERCTNPGIPDFYKPYFCLGVELRAGQKGSDWYVDRRTTWNGKASLRMHRRPIDRETSRGVFGACYPPPANRPQRMTFSFYAKGRDEKDTVAFIGFGLAKTQKTFRLTPDWKRYALSFDVAPAPNRDLGGRVYLICPGIGSTVWISGLQLERGDESTAFRDDSVLKKMTVHENPSNLIRNGGAEYGEGRFWNIANRSGTYVSTEARTGKYAFKTDNPHVGFRSNMFPIDRDGAYELSGAFMARPRPCRLVFGLLLYDKQKRLIRSFNVNRVKGTATVLAQACAKGDRILKVKDASKWTPRQYVAFEPEKGAPNFNVTPPIDSVYPAGEVWVIKLRKPCGFQYPAGTRIVAHRVGSNGVFPCVTEVSDHWTELRGVITPAALKRWRTSREKISPEPDPSTSGSPLACLRMGAQQYCTRPHARSF